MLLIPLFSTDMRSGITSERENRMLADRPPLWLMKDRPRHFIRTFERWFNDHVGLREKFISLYRMINKFQGKGPQYKEGELTYIIGKDGHYFFTGFNHEMIAKFQGRAVFSGEQLRTCAQN
jgi:hypothetical protein